MPISRATLEPVAGSDSGPRSRAAAQRSLLLRESRMVWENSFSFSASGSPSRTGPSPDSFSFSFSISVMFPWPACPPKPRRKRDSFLVSGEHWLAVFHSASQMLQCLRSAFFSFSLLALVTGISFSSEKFSISALDLEFRRRLLPRGLCAPALFSLRRTAGPEGQKSQ